MISVIVRFRVFRKRKVYSELHELLELANKCQNDENHLIFVLIHLDLALLVYFQKTYVFIIFLKPSSQLCLMNYFSFFLPINCQNHAA